MSSQVQGPSSARSSIEPKRRTRTNNRNKSSKIEINPDNDKRSTVRDLKVLLENHNIRFTNSTFTYKLTHFETSPPKKERQRSSLAKLSRKITNTLERVQSALSCESHFTNCLFFPVDDEEKVKEYITKTFADLKLEFENCKFIRRGSTIVEKVVRRLRKVVGIQFELQYPLATSIVDNYTIRLKDILFVNNDIQERILNEG